MGSLTTKTGKVGELARLTLKQRERVFSRHSFGDGTTRNIGEIEVRVQPEDPRLRAMVLKYLRTNSPLCQTPCIALDVGPGEKGDRLVAFIQSGRYQIVGLPSGVLEPRTRIEPNGVPPFGLNAKVEVGPIERRYVIVDGRPIGPPLEDAPTALEAPPSPR